MICLLLIMISIFVNGIANAEHRGRHLGTGLREEEMSAKTKAWLLMVESGKVDEEELRRITPKSIFIAPLLSGREEKCKEGYRYDHLGQCVKVIKIDPKVQLEMLLKRLNMLYSEKKEEEKEKEKEEVPQLSNGPLHFSIPILNEMEKMKTDDETKLNFEQEGTSKPESQNTPEFIPIPLPMVFMNQTKEANDTVTTSEHQTNQTKELESSGIGPLKEVEPYVSVQLEGSGISSGDVPQDQDYTSTISLLSEETDYLDVETTTEIPSTIETTTETFSTTLAPTADTVTTESYQSITDFPSVNVSDVNLLNETVPTPIVVENNSKSDIIHFPSEEQQVRTYSSAHVDSSFIRFPDDPPRAQSSYPSPPPVHNWNSQYQILASAVPQQQFWWLPENWKVDENQPKSSLVKFWSRLPLIHDVSYSDDKNLYNKPASTTQSKSTQDFNSLHKSSDYVISYDHHQVNKPFRTTRFQEILPTPGQPFRIHR